MRKILYIIPLFIFAFTFTGGPPSGWYQQFMPDLNGEPISDMYFVDSLVGFAVTGDDLPNDTNYILKTTNGGDNWTIKLSAFKDFFKIKFLDQNTGYVCGGFNAIGQGLMKTTDGGENWLTLNAPASIYFEDISVLNEDTIWLVQGSSLDGGVFRTTNGGMNWTQQLNLGSLNPDHVYFYNSDTGFAASTVLYKTTNSGVNWFQISGGTGFGEMYFMNATTGWKCYGPIQKTTDGGLNWQSLPLPSKGGNIILSRVNDMHVLNEDTIWGAGSVGIINSLARGLIYLTTNGGNTWGYQAADTSVNIFQYYHIQFLDKKRGWTYGVGSGIRTVTGGGDTTIYVGVNQATSTEIPIDFGLSQNYPNPFNPVTTITYYIASSSDVRLTVFDITGREVSVLVSQRQNPGVYQYSFDGTYLTSGIYFYQLRTDKFTDTKKMLLVK